MASYRKSINNKTWIPAIMGLCILTIIVFLASHCSYYINSREGFNNILESSSSNASAGDDNTSRLQQKYLLEQIASDPNKTNLDKDIMADLTQQYFASSDTLPMLQDFNAKAQAANPIAGGNQLIRDILRNYDNNN